MNDKQLAQMLYLEIKEQERLAKLSNRELVVECLNIEEADHPVVVEMMNRLYPGWWEPEDDTMDQ